VSVAELICHELAKDELFFTYPLFSKIHTIITEGLAKKTLYKTSYWLRNDDQEIVRFVTGIETEEHEISPMWLSKYNVDTNREIDKIKDAVMGGIYAFKSHFIQSRIADIRKELENVDSENMERIADLLSEQIILERVKQSIALKLGRIITH
jgi:DNA primase